MMLIGVGSSPATRTRSSTIYSATSAACRPVMGTETGGRAVNDARCHISL